MNAKRVTRDNRKNPEYHVVGAIGKLRTDKNCPAGKSASAFSEYMDVSQPDDHFIACYTVLTRPNKVETAVHGCDLASSLDSIMSLPR